MRKLRKGRSPVFGIVSSQTVVVQKLLKKARERLKRGFTCLASIAIEKTTPLSARDVVLIYVNGAVMCLRRH